MKYNRRNFITNAWLAGLTTTLSPGIPDFGSVKHTNEDKESPLPSQEAWMELDFGKVYLPLQIETTMSVKGNEQFKSGNWFWHEWDHPVATGEVFLGYLETARQMEVNLLLNCGPMANGFLRPEDEATLKSLRQ